MDYTHSSENVVGPATSCKELIVRVLREAVIDRSAVILDQSHYPVTSRGKMKFSRCPMTAASIHFNGYGYHLMVLG